MIFRCVLMLSLLQCLTSYRLYQANIPNGDAVPHPCKANYIWQGVGHFMDEGTGYRNPFGEDFEKEGHIWTKALCQKDSDGDGKTNGQELGDPDCVWTKGTVPAHTTGLSHPGVCDPYNSPACSAKSVSSPRYQTQEEWMLDMCKSKEFFCPEVNETGVRNISLTLPPGGKVPAKVTTYICQIFDFETLLEPGDYHLIAMQPILDNRYVIHHMIAFGCDDSEKPSVGSFECGMAASHLCTKVITIWTVGFSGECFFPKAGISIGTKGYKRIALQLHWNNPDSRSDWVDSSGMLLYYTPHKRQYESGVLITGVQKFILPPERQRYDLTGTCHSSCTRQSFKGTAYITSVWNHMHYAGRSGTVELIRNNKSVSFLINETFFSYDSPQVQHYRDNPVQLQPGDELITRCGFSTATRSRTTVWGEATSDEMCYTFLSFYPKENISNWFCVSDGPDVSKCEPASYQGCTDLYSYGNASWVNQTTLYRDLKENCNSYSPCLEECTKTIIKHKNDNPCLRGEIFTHIKTTWLTKQEVGRELLDLMASCDVEAYAAMKSTGSMPTPSPADDEEPVKEFNAASSTALSSRLLRLVTCLLSAASAGLTSGNFR